MQISKTVQAALAETEARLAVFSENPRLDAQVLLAHVLSVPRTSLLAHPEQVISPHAEDTLAEGISQLERGIPLPYVIGHWEFYALDFALTPDVLIPRPETELLVQTALEWLRINVDRRTALDVGVGSGIIAVTLAVHTRRLRVTAVDVSRPAVATARINAQRHDVAGQVHLFQGNLAEAVTGPFDLLCANLPYISSATLRELRVARAEPTQALNGGRDGLRLIRRLLADAPRLLAPGGLVLFEIEASQGPRVLKLARTAFPTAQAVILPDLAGNDRLLRVDLPPAPGG